jgi:hypothetical protein
MNNNEALLKMLDAVQVDLGAAQKAVQELEGKATQLRKQLEVAKANSSKAREYVQKLAKVRP